MVIVAIAVAGLIAVLFGALMLRQRSLYASAVCLLVVLLQTSIIFFCSGAPLMAFLQVMIYAGAVMVLVVVVIMAAGLPVQRPWAELSIPKPLAGIGLALALAEAAAMVTSVPPGAMIARGPEYSLGNVLFGPYAIATEAVALLLFLSALGMIPKGGER